MTSAHHVPDRIDRGDFARPEAPVLVAVLHVRDVRHLRGDAVDDARQLASDAVVGRRSRGTAPAADVHDRYEIDAVPIAVVVDRGGVVRASFAGSMSADDLGAAIDQVSTR